MIVAALLFFGLVASLFAGFTSAAPGLLIVSMVCALPMFMLALGAALGRASNELAIVRKERTQQSSVMRRQSAGRGNVQLGENLLNQ